MTATEQLAFDFDVETHEPYYFGIDDPVKCRDCHRTKFPWTHACCGARAEGMFELCDDCARDDLMPATDRSRWGIPR